MVELVEVKLDLAGLLNVELLVVLVVLILEDLEAFVSKDVLVVLGEVVDFRAVELVPLAVVAEEDESVVEDVLFAAATCPKKT